MPRPSSDMKIQINVVSDQSKQTLALPLINSKTRDPSPTEIGQSIVEQRAFMRRMNDIRQRLDKELEVISRGELSRTMLQAIKEEKLLKHPEYPSQVIKYNPSISYITESGTSLMTETHKVKPKTVRQWAEGKH
jgi:mevalonate pyrophosphate decarboxylase